MSEQDERIVAAWERFNTSVEALTESAQGEYLEQRRFTAFKAGYAAGRAASEQRAARYEAVVGITYWALKIAASEGNETAIEAVAEADRIADRERVHLAAAPSAASTEG